MSTDYDLLLSQSWDDFCDQLKAAGRIPFRPQVPAQAVDRAAGFRLLSRNISLALAFQYENNDPLHPELLHTFDPLRKQGGDNTDALYHSAQINGTDTYRISGQRGSARYFAVTLVETGASPWGGPVASVLFGDQVKVEADGSFELFISPEPQPGNWLRSTPNTFRVTVREFFGDWENEEPMQAHIDRLGETPPPELVPATLAKGLGDAARWVQDSINYWADMVEKWKARPNTFLSYRQLDDNKIDATPGGEPLISYWALPRDEALIVRVRPPKAQYWAVEFGSYWWETMDYRYRLSNTNCHYAQIEDDGELIVVVSHDDPGLPNWLDPSGFSEGYITYRWMLADQYPVPQCTQVKRSELFEHLPAQVRRIEPAQRREQLAARRRGVLKRFSNL
jgi:hypothetical protein